VSVDGAGRREQKELGSLAVAERGKVYDGEDHIAGARITAYRQDEVGMYRVFDGTAWGLTTPAVSDADGFWAMQLPAGTYYLTVEAQGYFTTRTQIFLVETVTTVTQDISLARRLSVRVGGWHLAWPDILGGWVEVYVRDQAALAGLLVGKPLPFFSVEGVNDHLFSSSLRGKPSVMVFVSAAVLGRDTWLGQLDQLAREGVRVEPVLVHETAEQGLLAQKRLGLSMRVWTDPQGDVSNQLTLSALPAVLIVDGAGNVVQQLYGNVPQETLAEEIDRLTR
jgi:hypothetical protein